MQRCSAKVASEHSVYVTHCDTLAILCVLLLQSFDLLDVFILLLDKVVHVKLCQVDVHVARDVLDRIELLFCLSFLVFLSM